MRVVLGVALVGLVVCVGCGREPAPAITALGGKIEVDNNNAVVAVKFSSGLLTDAGLVHLKGLSKLKQLQLVGTRVTDAGLVHLKELANLQHLTLLPAISEPRFTDAGMVHLEGLINLRELNLSQGRFTDAGLVHLEGLTKLEILSLRGTKVTDAGLVHLEGLTDLRILYLENTKVSAAGIRKLRQALPKCNVLGEKISETPTISLSQKLLAQSRTEVAQFTRGVDLYLTDEKIYPGIELEKPTSDDNQFPVLYNRLLGDAKPRGPGGRSAPYIKLERERIVVEDADWDEDTDEAQDRWIRAARGERADPKVKKYYLDPWGNPYIYRCNRGQKSASWMLNPRSYDFYSLGPDGEDQTVLGGDLSGLNDDITNR